MVKRTGRFRARWRKTKLKGRSKKSHRVLQLDCHSTKQCRKNLRKQKMLTLFSHMDVMEHRPGGNERQKASTRSVGNGRINGLDNIFGNMYDCDCMVTLSKFCFRGI